MSKRDIKNRRLLRPAFRPLPEFHLRRTAGRLRSPRIHCCSSPGFFHGHGAPLRRDVVWRSAVLGGRTLEAGLRRLTAVRTTAQCEQCADMCRAGRVHLPTPAHLRCTPTCSVLQSTVQVYEIKSVMKCKYTHPKYKEKRKNCPS